MERITLDWANMEIECEYETRGNEVHLNNVTAIGKWDNFDLLYAFSEMNNPIGDISTKIAESISEPCRLDESDISDMVMDERRLERN